MLGHQRIFRYCVHNNCRGGSKRVCRLDVAACDSNVDRVANIHHSWNDMHIFDQRTIGQRIRKCRGDKCRGESTELRRWRRVGSGRSFRLVGHFGSTVANRCRLTGSIVREPGSEPGAVSFQSLNRIPNTADDCVRLDSDTTARTRISRFRQPVDAGSCEDGGILIT
jgi:hypothetical protein